ncbi:phosphate/phosphite/phosphonate ABC transporter substrate-binding protein [uncultured Cocleimonas sp.]|uniref:phosphate/phosphite/phosphonate ABC transporter substrate-binding protein n=1 Tax=uncultured Cocleimonas sp. TaxID=1051587 RepID=UPI0026323CC0|nr:phosphate/phosphite/phosphonate ABC transporter substrate-binding protein [uncultured Cocleimonas sp.]
MHKKSLRVILTTLFISVCSFSSSVFAEKSYTVGVVPQFDARRTQEVWTPILKQLEAETGKTFKLVGSPDIPEFEKAFNAGEYDFAYMNPYHLIVANKSQGYQPIVRDIGRKLYGVIVVKKDSPITDVKQLDGKVVALPAPNALGAALIPRTEFATKFMIKPEYKYVKSHSSVYLNVLLGQAEAGGGVQKTFSQQKPEVKDNLRILYETTKVAPHPVAVHPRVSAEVSQQVQDAFLKMAASEKDMKLLQKIPMKQLGVAELKDYDELLEMGLESFYVK